MAQIENTNKDQLLYRNPNPSLINPAVLSNTGGIVIRDLFTVAWRGGMNGIFQQWFCTTI